MKIIITKKQYKLLVYTLLDTITGGKLSFGESDRNNKQWVDINDSNGSDIMTIFYGKKSGKSPGCKNDLSLSSDFVEDLIKYIPHFRRKIFSEVMVDYVYDYLGVKCDCIDYNYNYNDSEDSFGYTRFAYNIKKKKRFKFN
jgi:hypothetical protein